MRPWEFVWLAYGIVWTAILLYLVRLKSRMRKAEAKLSQLKSTESAGRHAS